MKRLLTITTLFTLLHVSTLMAQLSGTKTIGTDGDYTTFADAVSDLNSQGVNGPVTFNVLNGTYSEQVKITADGTSTNTITFQSLSGNASDVILTFAASDPSDNYVVSLNECSYVSFKNMSLTAAGTSHGHVFTLHNAPNSTIMNNVINGVSTTSYTPDTQEIIYSFQSTTTPNHNTVISGNTINDGTVGVLLDGAPSAIQSGSQVTNNTFANQYYRAIWVSTQQSPKVNDNTISTNSDFNDFFAIKAEDCNNDLELRNNKINLSKGTGIHVRNGVGASSNTGLVANNFVRVGDDSTSFAIGIEIENNTYLDVYHNTVSINSSNNIFARAFWAWSSSSANNRIKNNIFSSPNSNGYAYYLQSGASSAIASSDYNNLDGGSFKFSHWDGTDHTSLAAFQAASNTDASSVSTPVTFADAANGDLHLSGGSVGDLTLAGNALSSVTDDIDGDIRHPSLPYMGADEAGTALPVELTSFTYSVINKDVYLDWVTATETNNFGFEVEKKVPGNNWQKIGFVQGKGTTIEAQHYNFVDADLANGDYQYRLKQIDTDGNFEYSSILSVSVGGPATTRLEQNYPNPFNPTTNVIYSIQKEGFVQLEIYDLLGRTVKSLLSEIKSAGEYSLSWDGKNDQGELVASGIYYYTVKVENETLYSKRMILMK